MKIVINRCGAFGLSERAYGRLIELGVPVRKYGIRDDANDDPDTAARRNGEVIFDTTLEDFPRTEDEAFRLEVLREFKSVRYFDCWICNSRSHPLVVRVVEELGHAASAVFAELEVIEIPDGVQYEICECEGREWVAEQHRKWE